MLNALPFALCFFYLFIFLMRESADEALELLFIVGGQITKLHAVAVARAVVFNFSLNEK